LHLGSLYAAAASYLDARSKGGRWIVRIEDLDRQREVKGSASGILRSLELFGFEWDGEVSRQQDRLERYHDALHSLGARGLTFECSCSRLQLEDESRYPGTCRDRSPPAGIPTATRLRIAPGHIAFSDRIQGNYRQDVCAAVGDIILKRRDQIVAYVLAVVVDDDAQGVTHIVRGADLLDNTPRQMLLQQMLGIAHPSYSHVPVLMEPNGSKLAKSKRAVPLSGQSPLPQLLSVFSLLGLVPPSSLQSAGIADAWEWAIRAWAIEKVPKRLNLALSD
jgi:glutamyl-Q tRNA(Asp) synthetase